MKKYLNFINMIGAFVLGGLLLSAGVASATLRVVQTPVYHLYTGESGSATTMRITPFPKDLDGTKLTMADFGTTPTVTVDPGKSGIEEIESFTGITDNGDGTGTLTGLTRDLLSKYPYTTAGTGRTHSSGATVVFGNNPQIYGRLTSWENQGTTTAVWYYGSTVMPRYDVDPGAAAFTAAAGTVFVSMDQLGRTAIAGGSNATRALQGFLQIAFRGQAASSTALGSTGAFGALTTDIATSSPSIAMSTSSVVMTGPDSRINPLFMSTSTLVTYSFGAITVTGTTTMATSTVIAGTTGGLSPAGTIVAYASSTAPAGWLLADGSSLLRTAYPQLFAVIGVYYGSADGTHFTLPNLTGRTPVMASTTANIGQFGGEDRHTLTQAQLPNVNFLLPYSVGQGTGAGNALVSGGTTNVPSGGGDQPFNVRDPYLAVQYIIKY